MQTRYETGKPLLHRKSHGSHYFYHNNSNDGEPDTAKTKLKGIMHNESFVRSNILGIHLGHYVNHLYIGAYWYRHAINSQPIDFEWYAQR